MTFHDRLIHELTKMDERDSKKKSYNPYALAQYFQAAENVIDAATFAKVFIPTRTMHTISKRLNLGLDVDHGNWITERMNQ